MVLHRRLILVCLITFISFFFTAGVMHIGEELVVAEDNIPIDLSGQGQKATDSFSLPSGSSIFKMKHTGSSNFSVRLLDDQGELVDLLVNEIGSFDGQKALGIETAGDYLLDIAADGPWTITIESLRPEEEEAPSVPREFSGNSQQATEMFSIGSGLARFEMTHDGSSNFSVRLLDDQGQLVELLVNEIGAFQGSKATSIRQTGKYLLDIAADGNWNIKVTGPEAKPEEMESGEESEEKDSDEEGCFIATAVYGSASAEDIDVLRSFRDKVLLTDPVGKKLVHTYYNFSPPLAEVISHQPIARFMIREMGIKPIVKFLETTEDSWATH